MRGGGPWVLYLAKKLELLSFLEVRKESIHGFSFIVGLNFRECHYLFSDSMDSFELLILL